MAFDFPAGPIDGVEFTPPGGPTYVWSAATPGWLLKDDSVLAPVLTFGIGLTQTGNDVALDAALPAVIGGVVEAPADGAYYSRQNGVWAIPPAGPVPVDAYTKAEVDAKQAQDQLDFVNVTGDTMTGFLTLNANPTAPLHAAPKQYVDTHLTQAEADLLYVNVTGDTMSGALTITASPESFLNITSATGSARVYLSAAAGNAAFINGATAGIDRWQLQLGDQSAESNFRVIRRNNAGVEVDSPIHISRNTGVVTIENSLANPTLVIYEPYSATGVNAGISQFVNWSAGIASIRISQTISTTSSAMVFANSNGQIGSIVNNGSATAYNTTSDGRLKTNSVPLAQEIDLGAFIDALRPIAFDWLSGVTGEPTGERARGFVAQDLYALHPSLASVGSDETKAIGDEGFEPWGTDNTTLIPYLVAEIQALRARIAVLETPVMTPSSAKKK